jgi:hypothetical protein
MNAGVARRVARRLHGHQFDRSGEPLINHVERVAGDVPPPARAVAYLHDVLERVHGAGEELRELGLSDEELSVLGLLTRHPDELYSVYVMRIAHRDGRVGRIARTVKLADLDDHLRQRARAGAPDYAWAREQIVAAQLAHGEAPMVGGARREMRRTGPRAKTADGLRRTG